FLTPRLGFVATTGGANYEEGTGYLPPTEPGLIERTTDGGVSWRVVVRAPGIVFEQIAFAGRRVGLAIGNRVPRGKDPGPIPPLRPVSFLTEDGGRHWRRIALPAPVAGSHLELPAEDVWYALGRRLLLSSDEGRTWAARSLPRGAALTTFPTPEIGFT